MSTKEQEQNREDRKKLKGQLLFLQASNRVITKECTERLIDYNDTKEIRDMIRNIKGQSDIEFDNINKIIQTFCYGV